MQTFLSVIGAFALITAVAVAIRWVGINVIAWKAELQEWRRESRRASTSLLRDSWWFSEDPPTMHLLQSLGKSIDSGKSYSVTDIRDKWRECRAKHARDAK